MLTRSRHLLAVASLLLGALAFWCPPSGAAEASESTAEIDDAQLERLLLEGKIVDVQDLSTGVTHPLRVWVELDGLSASAGFKSVDIEKSGLSRMAGAAPEMNFTDRYTYERAAYLLDRRLGIGMVPVTVLRSVKGEKGSLTAWVDDSITEKERQAQRLSPPIERIELSAALMRLFDALILNVDRNAGNVLYMKDDWRIFLIDHSRSFRTDKRLPDDFESKPVMLTSEILDNLKSLDKAELQSLMGDLVSSLQIKALLARRDKILKRIETERRARGDAAVLVDSPGEDR